MTYDIVKQAIEELQDVVRCRCHPGYTDRGLHDPRCECDSKDAVKIVADRIATLEELLGAAVRDAKEAETYVAELEKRRVAILQERDAAVERLIKQRSKNQ